MAEVAEKEIMGIDEMFGITVDIRVKAVSGKHAKEAEDVFRKLSEFVKDDFPWVSPEAEADEKREFVSQHVYRQGIHWGINFVLHIFQTCAKGMAADEWRISSDNKEVKPS